MDELRAVLFTYETGVSFGDSKREGNKLLWSHFFCLIHCTPQGGPAYRSLVTMATLIAGSLSGVKVDDVQTMIGIQHTNSFEINATGIEGRALYPIISKINHSCIPNVAHCNAIIGKVL